MKKIIFAILVALMFQSCSENYSNGERVGFVTKFSQRGILYKSWEGELNLTQTGMNTSSLFPFSVDNDSPEESVIKTLDSAANLGWKVKIVYHETIGKNWFRNRGETSHFVKSAVVLDRNPMQNVFGNKKDERRGKVIDTIYVVIDRTK
jgi:hypothetical protein